MGTGVASNRDQFPQLDLVAYPNRPSNPPDIPIFKEESSASAVKMLVEGDVEVTVVSPSGEKSPGKSSSGQAHKSRSEARVGRPDKAGSSKKVIAESSAAYDNHEKQEKTESALIPRKQKVSSQTDPHVRVVMHGVSFLMLDFIVNRVVLAL